MAIQMKVPATQGVRYFDFYHGEELKPDVRDAGHSLIRFPIEAKGYGAVLAQQPGNEVFNSRLS